MNKSDLIKKIASDADITQTQAKAALQTVEVGIVEALINGENLKQVREWMKLSTNPHLIDSEKAGE